MYDDEIIYPYRNKNIFFENKLEFSRRKEFDNIELKTVMFFNDSKI